MESFKFYQNKSCPHFPCHAGSDPDSFNCWFCYCPLYALGDKCGGGFCYTSAGIKDCSGCLIPHSSGGYDRIMARMNAVLELAKRVEIATDKP